MTTQNDNLPGRAIGKRHTPNQNDAPEYYSEQQTTQHTPGPWRNNGGRIEGGDYGSRIAVVATVGKVNEQSLQDTANARLIAAAPDLLAACQEALVRLIDLEDNATGEHSPTYLAIKAAIAKASGQTKDE